jgi:hypothetical protein
MQYFKELRFEAHFCFVVPAGADARAAYARLRQALEATVDELIVDSTCAATKPTLIQISAPEISKKAKVPAKPKRK